MARPLKYGRSFAKDGDKGQAGLLNPARLLILLSFALSLAVLIAVGLTADDGNDAETNQGGSLSNRVVPPKTNPTSGSPLVVPVYPRGTKMKGSPISTDLRDNYIILEDGSALSMADWILGSLKKDASGIAMTDYENRLFLGQVARAAVGLDEGLVHHSYVNVAPTVTFRAPPPPGAAIQTLQAVLGVILPGTSKGWHPAKTGGAFSPMMKSGGGGAILFEGQFHNTLMHTASEFKELGTMRIMLKEAEKAREAGKDQ